MSFSYVFDHENSKSREDKLQQLIQAAQEQIIAKKTELFTTTLQEIVELILYSRPICRQYNGQPLFGVYREIYDQVKSKLLEDITQKLEQSNSIDSHWLYWKQTQIFQLILDDVKFKKLALVAKSTPTNSSFRSYALRELVKAIQLSQRLIRMRYQCLPSQFDKLIYEEAVVETLAYVCTKIDLYDPERGNKRFMNWVNFTLQKTLIKCRQEFQNPHIIKISSWSDLENISYQKNNPSLSELIYQYIQQDSQNIFQSTFIKGKPQANFRQIALARLSGYTWKEISQELKLSIPTLSSFFQRNCEKFQDLFKKEFKN